MVTSREFNTSRKAAGLPLVRFDLRKLSDEDILDLRHAYEALYAISEAAPGDKRGYWAIAAGHGYDEDLCHQDSSTFLGWHRAYIYVFEKMLSAALQGRRGDDGILTLPYWDWTMTDAGTDDADGIPRALTDDTYVDPDDGVKPNPLASGPSKWRVDIVAPSSPNTKRYVTSSFGPGIAGFASLVDDFLNRPSYRRFMTFQSAFNSNPHGTVHVRLGGLGDPDIPTRQGDMGDTISAAYDPIFWLHHCMVDKVWFDWQQKYGDGTVPNWVRQRGVYSPDNEPWRVEDTLDTEQLFNYTYGISPLGGTAPPHAPEGEIEAPLPLTIDIDVGDRPALRDGAILTLHGVSPPRLSVEVRIFVNPPETPTPDTPTDLEYGYANSIFFFGHGTCPGAPGHCNPDAEERGPYDRRGGHPLTRRNYIADITDGLARVGESERVRLAFLVLDPAGAETDLSIVDVETISVTAQ